MPPAAAIVARPDKDAIGALLAREYGLHVSSLDLLKGGVEGFKFVAQVGPRGYLVKVVPASKTHALRFSAGATGELSRRGCRWVVPPLATLAGCFVAKLEDSAVEVRPFVVGTSLDAALLSSESLEELGRMLGELHAAGRALTFDDTLDDDGGPAAQNIDAIIESAGRIDRQDPRWPTARMLLETRVALREAARLVDSLRSHVNDARDRWVVTHGDATPSNVVVDASGQKYLIDWTSARMTPPERDVVQYATPRFGEFLAGYQREAPVDRFSLDVVSYYLHRWQVDGVRYFGRRVFDGDPRGGYESQNESGLRLFIPYRSGAVAESLAIVERALRLSE